MSDAAPSTAVAPFRAPWGGDDAALAQELCALADARPADAAQEALARDLVAAIRAAPGLGGVEDLLHEFSLSTAEGLALMMLAEALLRIPDAATADLFIEDRLESADWEGHAPRSEASLVAAAIWALAVAARIVRADESPSVVLAAASRRIGAPALRVAARRAVRIVGDHFVAGETIEDALRHARKDAGSRYSFDMLGEGARTQADAERYFDAYRAAIRAVAADGAQAGHSVSVKLSALHPRFEAISRERVLRELAPRLEALAREARDGGVALTVDAEEADRLELTLDVFAAVARSPALAGWDGLGVAVQAYQKRARAVIDWLGELAAATRRVIPTRLVKGAYWDGEIKRAQERGLDDFPVFTQKALTDLHYLACAERLLAQGGRLAPQFATHSAPTVAAVLARAGGAQAIEFQRLHGMGDRLYARLRASRPDVAVRVYAPVGAHRDLLAYLVRRILENGAASSFVAQATDPRVSVERLLRSPQSALRAEGPRHPGVRAPADLFRPERANSRGVEFGHAASLDALLREVAAGRAGGVVAPEADAGEAEADAAMARAADAWPAWEATPAAARATVLDRAADLFEARRGRFLALLQDEGGKTLDDALGEVRETVDFCRYYAAQARALAGAPTPLPGPAGEENRLIHRGRGVFVCISPWNFPLSIFVGQVAAALAMGNAVVAKPAEQTPRTGFAAVALLHEAGAPPAALQAVRGDGRVGARLVAHEATAGVAFTGSTEAASAINATLSRRRRIAPLIAETGGVNAMIVDASALLEQTADDVVASAFRSAGQRCSALRLLCVQEEIADALLSLVAGAAETLKIGDPREIDTHVGPVIDADAKGALDAYLARRAAEGRILWRGRAPERGCFVAPHIVRLDRAEDLTEEVFGPVLHVARWSPRDDGFERLLAAINASGYGLTVGVQTRILGRAQRVADAVRAGNVYVNRSMIGAVVGSQPFGGMNLSGTGPKAGGPDYLRRFAVEQTVSVNAAAVGGAVALLSGATDGEGR